jgi:mono/diheme cytochrome c family protein
MTKLVSISFVSLLFACGGGSKPATTTVTDPPPAGDADPALTAQIEKGKALYVEKCASCHGDAGQGTEKGPVVVGKDAFPLKPREGAKRDVEFRTAADVFAWASKTMPGDKPGTIPAEDMLAIFAFDLTANGVKLTAPLDGPAAQAIVLHP